MSMAMEPYLAMTAGEIRGASVLPRRTGWLSCHFSPSGAGLSNLPVALPPGSLLILDDSMSALDYATDLALRRALQTKMQNVTKIIVSQRATSIQHADHILVMDDGACVGYGTHDQLLEHCPVYADIYRTQMQ